MVFPILGGNGAGAEQYLIDNSLRFNSVDSADLTFTLGTPTSQQKFTESFWLKRGLTGGQRLFKGAGVDNSNKLYYGFNSDQLNLTNTESGGVNNLFLKPNAYYRDYGAWYHVVLSVDTTQATSSDRAKLYVNGEQVTDFATALYPPLNHNFVYYASGTQIQIGDGYHATVFFYDGYMAEINFIDGQALSPTDFGEFSEEGIWKPIEYTGTFGNNGYYLDFENSGSLGADQSGNGNNFTPTNLASTDQTTDTPTNNFATWNVLKAATSGCNLSEGNLQFNLTSTTGGGARSCGANMKIPSSGKWYYEAKLTHQNLSSDSGNQLYLHLADNDGLLNPLSTTAWNQVSGVDSIGLRVVGTISDAIQNCPSGSCSTYDTNPDLSSGDIVGMAVDMDNGKLYIHLNGTYYNDSGGTTANPSAGTNENVSFTVPTDGLMPYISILNWSGGTVNASINFGNPAFSISSGNSDDNGYGNFEYAPPSGYLALCTQNLATELSPTIDDGSAYFHTQLYAGNGGTQSITNDANAGDFQPDWLWIKNRTGTDFHGLFDSNRGSTKRLFANDTSAESTQTAGVTSFDSDGFSLGSNLGQNRNSNNFVAWQWKANAGSTSSNTDGSITSTVQANTTAGFSIITYTGTGASGSVGHGLTKAPEMVICKQRTDAGTAWQTGHTGLTNWTYKLLLNDTVAESVNANVFPSAPTSTVINLGLAGDSNGSGKSQLIYAFHSVEGYSKFGKYTGNGSTDGTFIYTGFRPAFVLLKRYQNGPFGATDGMWVLHDSVRNPNNDGTMNDLYANVSDAENTTNANDIDILSNGFKARANNNNVNYSTGLYIYMAFAESPFVSSTGIPVTAR